MKRIETAAELSEGLAFLRAADPRLAAIARGVTDLPLRRSAPGFASLVSIVVSQQISRASADAIMARLSLLVDPLTPAMMTQKGEAALRAAGLSRPKQRTLTTLCEAVLAGGIDLAAVAERDADEAIATLTALHGIGPWTAQIYLLFAAGHPDIFPAGDLALQIAAADVLALPARPSARQMHLIAESWSPWRGVAARLLWVHYAGLRGRDAVPLAAAGENAVEAR